MAIEKPQRTAIAWRSADKLELTFAGKITLDLNDEADRELFAQLDEPNGMSLTVEVAPRRASVEWLRGRDGQVVGAAATRHLQVLSAWADPGQQ